MRRLGLMVTLVAGCHRQTACEQDPASCETNTSAAWIQSFDWSWSSFNHRLSVLRVVATDDAVSAAVVGGASTTGHVYDDDGTCVNADTCWELPTRDATAISATRATATSDTVLLAHGSLTLDTTSNGVSQTLTVTLPRLGVDGDAVSAWIGGVTMISDVAADGAGASCYDPRHGWLPAHVSLGLSGAALSDALDAVDVEVSAAFLAGEARETQRACYDALRTAGTFKVTLDVVVAVGDLSSDSVDVAQGAIWSSGTDAQPLTEVGTLDATLDPAAMIGWTSLDLEFHETVEAGRGAYLRGLSVQADDAAGQAYGYATNRSLTALSGFDYAFKGTVTQVSGDVAVERARFAQDAMPTELDPVTFEPVWHDLPAAP
jgi:hypothetical protein